MSSFRPLGMHLGVLALSGLLALRMANDQAHTPANATIVFDQAPETVLGIRYDGSERAVRLERRQDAVGRYFEGTSTQVVAPSPAVADAGAAAPKEGASRTRRFVAVEAASELLDSMHPLLALRALGKLEVGRSADFGFLDGGGEKLSLLTGTGERVLTIGGGTPGGADFYVRDEAGEYYVVAGGLVREVRDASVRLLQRRFHLFDSDRVHSVRITFGEASRELERLAGVGEAWASRGAGEQDEMASNWMSKLGRLRVSTYPDEPISAEALFRVDYFDSQQAKLGHFELASVTLPDSEESSFLARSETTRWYGTILRATGEELLSDVSGVVRPSQ